MSLPSLDTFNTMDLILGVLMLLFVLRGLFHGLLRELATLLAFTLGIFASANARVHGYVMDLLENLFSPSPWVSLAAYLLVFIAVVMGVSLMARLVDRLLGDEGPSLVDRLLGGLAGLLEGAAVGMILLVVWEHVAPENSLLYESVLAPKIQTCWRGISSFAAGLQ